MTTFTFDTLQPVALRTPDGDLIGYRHWSDLTPFQQGYVEALLRALDAQRWQAYRASCAASPGRHLPVPLHPAFRWLSPEALALILRDCQRFTGGRTWGADVGRGFWLDRQEGSYTNALDPFPPLTVTLSDAGKVELRTAA
jgi:hypothetical protein